MILYMANYTYNSKVKIIKIIKKYFDNIKIILIKKFKSKWKLNFIIKLKYKRINN